MATKKELKEQLESLGFDVPSDANKAELEDMLEDALPDDDGFDGWLGEGRDPWWNR
jgi:hypothetical protein